MESERTDDTDSHDDGTKLHHTSSTSSYERDMRSELQFETRIMKFPRLTVTVEEGVDSSSETSDFVDSSVGSLKESSLVLSLNSGIAL